MFDKLFTLTAISAVAYALHRAATRINRHIDRDFLGLVLADAATWLARRLPAPVDRIEPALHDLVVGQPCGPLLDPVLRIECEILPVDAPTRREVRTHVWMKAPDGVKSGTITRIVPYEAIPEDPRAHFIYTGQDHQIWALYERHGAPAH